MRFRRPEEEEVRLSIAPLIDVVFLLLIFFMVTSHFDVASGVRIQLPKVAKKIFTENRNKLTLVIDREGSVYIKGKKVEFSDLKVELEAIKKEKGIFQLILHADKDVRHGRVVEIMDLAKTAGAHSIIIAARWKPDKAF